MINPGKLRQLRAIFARMAPLSRDRKRKILSRAVREQSRALNTVNSIDSQMRGMAARATYKSGYAVTPSEVGTTKEMLKRKMPFGKAPIKSAIPRFNRLLNVRKRAARTAYGDSMTGQLVRRLNKEY